MSRVLLFLVFVVQLAFPVGMIVQREVISSQGELVKFEVEPFDPYDAFRGRYLQITVKGSQGIVMDTKDFERNQQVYARIWLDGDGFGRISDVFAERPENGLYVTSRVAGYINVKAGSLDLSLPFNRYYINGKYASKAEEIFREISDAGLEKTTYVTVRVRNGRVVIKEMYLSGVEINELVRRELQKEEG